MTCDSICIPLSLTRYDSVNGRNCTTPTSLPFPTEPVLSVFVLHKRNDYIFSHFTDNSNAPLIGSGIENLTHRQYLDNYSRMFSVTDQQWSQWHFKAGRGLNAVYANALLSHLGLPLQSPPVYGSGHEWSLSGSAAPPGTAPLPPFPARPGQNTNRTWVRNQR